MPKSTNEKKSIPKDNLTQNDLNDENMMNDAKSFQFSPINRESSYFDDESKSHSELVMTKKQTSSLKSSDENWNPSDMFETGRFEKSF